MVYVYSVDDLSLTGQLDGTKLGTHNGVLTLADGRILFTDDALGHLLVVRVDEAGVPAIESRIPVWQGSRIVWSSVDPDGTQVILASQILESPALQVLNVVDLATGTVTVVQLPMLGDEEIIGWMADDTTLVASVGGAVATYAADALGGPASPAPIGTVQIEAGSHGAVADPANSRFWVTTAAGFEVVDLTDAGPVHATTVPWDIDGLTGGQNFRPRMTPDGRTVVGVLTAPPAAPEEWATAQVSVHLVDVASLEARRVELGVGRFAGRWGLSDSVALFAGTDGETGAAHVFDLDPASPAFGTVLRSVALDLPAKGAVPGTPTTGTEGYLTTLTADGTTGFVVHGGDGRISVIDVAGGTITGIIETPTALTGAGYATVIEPAPNADLFLR